MQSLDLPRSRDEGTIQVARIVRRGRKRRELLGGFLALLSLPLGLGSLELIVSVNGLWGLVGVVGFSAALTLDLVYARRLSGHGDW